jgi:protein O-GlcNAc transferase
VTPDLAATFQQALQLHRQGRLAEAATLYRALLAHAPTHAEALSLLGMLEHGRGDAAAAEALLARAVAAKPGDAGLHLNRGNLLLELGRPQDALASYDVALALVPGYAEAHNNRAGALLELNRPVEALASSERAIQLAPDYPDAHMNRGNALLELRRAEEALASYDNALRLDSGYAEAHNNHGNALMELKRFEDALASYTNAQQLAPEYPDACMNLGNALRELKRSAEALASFEQALRLKPDYPEALFYRGLELMTLKRFADAADSFARLLALVPDYDYAPGYLFHARLHACDWRDYTATAGRIVSGIARGEKRDEPFTLLAHCRDAAAQLQAARIYASDKYPAAVNAPASGARYRHDRIRVAYLSSDFHDHATSYLMAELFEAHDRSRFETHALSFGPGGGSMQERLRRAFYRFIDIGKMDDWDAAKLLAELEIDIAVDLKGYTGSSRPGIFAQRGAPLQVAYLGFPATTGAPSIDYMIADPRTIPPGHERFYSEKIVRLPDSYQVNDRKRVIAERIPSRKELGLPENAFVFCSFNNSYKIAPDVFDIWMRLLQRVEGSVLWLFGGNADAPRNLAREAERRGVAANRLVFAPRLPLPEHLARHRQADLFLDTFPCNAHTTASDALWAGLPLVTCMGETFASRVAGSLLHAAGLPDLIARDLSEYEVLAYTLAATPEMLADVKTRLAKNRMTCPLFDTKRFRRHLEAAYAAMHERHLRGEPPAGFDVPLIQV